MCCLKSPLSEAVDGSESVVCSSGTGGSVTGLGGFAFSATRGPLDNNMKTSLWECKNYIGKRKGKATRVQKQEKTKVGKTIVIPKMYY